MADRDIGSAGRRRRRRRLIGPAALVVLGGGLLAGAWIAAGSAPAEPRGPQRALAAPPAAAVTRPVAANPALRRRARAPRQVADPVRLRIPAIGLTARVGPLGLNPDGSLEVPSDFAATGWYRAGPEPGEVGAAVIVGHVDSTTGPAVFYDLETLRRGDRITVIRTDRTRVSFRVQALRRVAKDDFPTTRVYGKTRWPALRLITCDGEFDRSTGHYVDNLIVFARAER